MTRLGDMMDGYMDRAASTGGPFGEVLTLYNYVDENDDPTDAADWSLDDGTPAEGQVDWMTNEDVVQTVGGEEIRADARLYIPTRYDVRDGGRDGERASVVETEDGHGLRIKFIRTEGGVYRCDAVLRNTTNH